MFFNLAWRNARRSRSQNMIYFLTLVTAVASFYIVLALEKQDVIRFLAQIESDAIQRLLTSGMPSLYLAALIFLLFLVIFANKYQMECRSRELGLYLILGMKKSRLFFQLLLEGFMTSAVSFGAGIICGTFLSELISLATIRMVGQGIISHQLSFSVWSVIWTGIGFFAIQAVAFFILGGRLFYKEIYTLLYGENEKKQRAGSAKGGILTLLLGLCLLGMGYVIAFYCFTAAKGLMLMLAVILGIGGTLLFIRGMARLFSLMARRIRGLETNGLWVFTLRQLQENIVSRFISMGAASILIMFTIILIADGAASILAYEGPMSRNTSVYDFTVTGSDTIVERALSSKALEAYVDHLNRMVTGKMKRPSAGGEMDSLADFSGLREQVVLRLPEGVSDPKALGAVSYNIDKAQPPALNLLAALDGMETAPDLIALSDYNSLLEAAGCPPLILGDTEAAIYLNPDFWADTSKEALDLLDKLLLDQKADTPLLTIAGQPVKLHSSVELKGITADENIRIFTALIVPDIVFNALVDPERTAVYWNFCIPSTVAEQEGLLHAIMSASDILSGYELSFESYLNNFGRKLFYVLSESYTTLYMGFMFMLISCAMLALLFLIQLQSTKQRYGIVALLGAKRRQLKRSIHIQILCYFLCPLLPACANGIAGLIILQKYTQSYGSEGGQRLLMSALMACGVIFILAVYGIAVARTADKELELI